MLDACVRAAGRSWWGKADLAGGRVQGAGGELSRTHVCERMPSYLKSASPRRCIVWLPKLNRSATVGSSTCTLTKCGYLSVVDVACEIQYRRPSDSNLRGWGSVSACRSRAVPRLWRARIGFTFGLSARAGAGGHGATLGHAPAPRGGFSGQCAKPLRMATRDPTFASALAHFPD